MNLLKPQAALTSNKPQNSLRNYIYIDRQKTTTLGAIHMIGERLKQLRQERGIKQKEFANIIGIKKSSMSMYETNRNSPNFETMAKIVQYFNVSADFLIGVIDKTVPPFNETDFAQIPKVLTDDDRKMLLGLIEYLCFKTQNQ